MCGEAVARLVARRTRAPFDPNTDQLGGAARPVAVPVPLGVLAAEPTPDDPAPADIPPGGTP
jgi:hypothetical protein